METDDIFLAWRGRISDCLVEIDCMKKEENIIRRRSRRFTESSMDKLNRVVVMSYCSWKEIGGDFECLRLFLL